jgi:hypothetical protein
MTQALEILKQSSKVIPMLMGEWMYKSMLS